MTKQRIRYDADLMQQIIARDECSIPDFAELVGITNKSYIEYTCKCGNETGKSLKSMWQYGARCHVCTEIDRQAKVKATCIEKFGVENALDLVKINGSRARITNSVTGELIQHFTYETLESIVERDNCTITDIDKYKDYLHRESRIEFTCSCGKDGNKTFRRMLEGLAICKDCTVIGKIANSLHTWRDKYGVDHPSRLPEFKEKCKTTSLERYGVDHSHKLKSMQDQLCKTRLQRYGYEHILQSPEFQEKCKDTCRVKYGHDHSSQSAEIKNKKVETFQERYGVNSNLQMPSTRKRLQEAAQERYGVQNFMHAPEIQEKSRNSCMERFGVPFAFQSQEIRDKSKATSIVRYGVPYAMQNSAIANKASSSAYKIYDYTYASGAIVKLQGFERFAIDKLVREGYDENTIVTDRSAVPEIWYTDDAEQRHRYFVDIFIPNEKRMIEVKSRWTQSKNLDKLKWTEAACVAKGYTFELWVFDVKGNLIKDI